MVGGGVGGRGDRGLVGAGGGGEEGVGGEGAGGDELRWTGV